MNFSLVVAVDASNGIGKNNTLAWKLPTDLKHFAAITTEVKNPSKMNAVIMGRNTWESLPEKHRPLKDRLNIVLSRNPDPADLHLPSGVILCHSLDEALQKIDAMPNIENTHVIGGAKVFNEAINHPKCQIIYLTRLAQTFDCDTFFPSIDQKGEKVEKVFQITERSEPQHENGIDFEFLTYTRKT